MALGTLYIYLGKTEAFNTSEWSFIEDKKNDRLIINYESCSFNSREIVDINGAWSCIYKGVQYFNVEMDNGKHETKGTIIIYR